MLRPFYRDIVPAGYLARSDDGVLELTGRGQAEADKLIAAWKAWLMGELQDWLATHEVSPAQASEVEAALGRITLRLIREAEAGSAPAVAAVAGLAPRTVPAAARPERRWWRGLAPPSYACSLAT